MQGVDAGYTRDGTKKTLLWRLRKERRRFVKRVGRKFILGVANFIGRQGLVPDRPVHDRNLYPFLTPVEANWTTVKSELSELLKAQFSLRMQKATQQLNNTATLRSTRRDIARAKTILAEKQRTVTAAK